MAVNWTGTFSNTLGTGTCTGGDSNTTLTNTGATFDTSPELIGWTCRILSGLGAGQERVITTNSATVLTVSPAWTTTPNNTSVYEVVAILKNGDHVTGNVTFGAGTFTELENSATIYIDGSYTITLTNTCNARWNKTAGTLVTFIPNSVTTAGNKSFWPGFVCSPAAGGVVTLKFLKLVGAASGIQGQTAVFHAASSGVSNIWFHDCTGSMGLGTTVPTSDSMYSNILVTGGGATRHQFTNGDFEYKQIFSKLWIDRKSSAITIALFNSKNILRQEIRDSVYHRTCGVQTSNLASISAAGYVSCIQDSYYSVPLMASILGGGATDSGTKILARNDLWGGSILGTTGGTSTGLSSFNDYLARTMSVTNKLFNDTPGYSVLTSNNDLIGGYASATQDCIDVTDAATASTATPAQWGTLTANRTNAKSVRNRPLTLDNVVVGTPTATSVTITADSTNGVVAGQGSTTVDAESAAAQAVLNVTATTGFEVGELVEIAYGTAAFELLRVLSISAGASLTLETNLVNTHAIGVTVTKHLRHYGIPFIRYSTTTGVYNMSSRVPAEDKWGLIFTEIQTTFDGATFAWKRYGHSVALSNLSPGTKYYAKFTAYTPLGEMMESSEFTFTTAPGQGFAS